MAYSVLAGICIHPFCPTALTARATPMVDLVFALDHRHLYLCVRAPRRLRRRSCRPSFAAASTSSNCARRTSTTQSQVADAQVMIPICREFGVPFIMNDSPELAVAVGADGVTWVKKTSAWRVVANSSDPRRSSGLSTHSTERVRRRAESVGHLFQCRTDRRPLRPSPVARARASTTRVASQARSDRPVFVTGGVNAETSRPRRRGTSPLRRRARAHRVERPRGGGAGHPRCARRGALSGAGRANLTTSPPFADRLAADAPRPGSAGVRLARRPRRRGRARPSGESRCPRCRDRP